MEKNILWYFDTGFLFVFNSPAVATDTGFTPIQSSRHHHHHNNFVQAPHLLQAAATAAGSQQVSIYDATKLMMCGRFMVGFWRLFIMRMFFFCVVSIFPG
jgi:hypothetical protein